MAKKKTPRKKKTAAVISTAGADQVKVPNVSKSRSKNKKTTKSTERKTKSKASKKTKTKERKKMTDFAWGDNFIPDILRNVLVIFVIFSEINWK